MTEPLREVFFTESQIQSAVERMAQSVWAWQREQPSRILNVVSLLEGARPLTRDLTQGLQKLAPELRLSLHEIRVRGTDGHQNLLADREVDGSLDFEALRLHSVLVVDDLVDSGLTLKKLKGQLTAQGIETIRTAVLIRKFGDQSGPVDFLGFDLKLDPATLAPKGFKDCWLYGYGMDLDGQHRDLPRVEGIYIPAPSLKS